MSELSNTVKNIFTIRMLFDNIINGGRQASANWEAYETHTLSRADNQHKTAQDCAMTLMPLEVQHITNKEENNMEIIKKSEGLTSADLYSLTKGSDVRKMADAKGEILEISKFVLYQDTDVNGEPMQVLSVETAHGVRYATNSKTFVRNFKDILDIFEISGEPLPTKFKVGSGRSKSNREYLTCDISK